MPSQLRVLLAEDHPLMRDCITRLLSQNCIIAGTVESADAILAAVQEQQPDAVVMDISMPGRSGLQILPELRSAFPKLVIVLLTNHDSAVYRQAAMQRGADGYVLKQNAASDLWLALQDGIAAVQRIKTVLHAAV